MKGYFQRIPVEEYDDEVHEYVDKLMATQCKEANKQLSITEFCKIQISIT